MRVDHVLVAVTDLEAAAALLRARHGLDAHAGGRHPQWGTANRIVPLGQSYLELVAVVDDATAQQNAFGSWVAAQARSDVAPFAWCVSPTSLDATAARLGLEVEAGSRTTPSGATLGWRIAGLERAAERHWLPFFIEWSDDTPHPGRRDGPSAELRLEIEGDVEELAGWLGAHVLPIRIRPGRGGVSAVVIEGPNGPVTLSRAGG